MGLRLKENDRVPGFVDGELGLHVFWQILGKGVRPFGPGASIRFTGIVFL